MIQATLCFIFRADTPRQVLLGYKKRGFGRGKYGGFGGKLRIGETSSQAALRELHEEAGIGVEHADLVSMGVIKFIFPYKPEWDQEVYIFTASKWQGAPTESEEMVPEWFDISGIPFLQMWDDNHYWLPYILAGEKIHAVFTFNSQNDIVTDFQIQPI